MPPCDVCGRTILAGERVRVYMSGDGRRSVCELCAGRAERLGWRPEDDADREDGALRPAKRRLGDLLRRRREQEATAAPDPEPPAPDPDPDPAAAGRTTGLLAADPSPLGPFERATARFNASEAGRTVAGLIRTLGRPSVSVGASAGAANEVRITVAWELSWYQWGVDLGDELRPVFQIDKGFEVAQLDAAARQWNAVAGDDGRLSLGAADTVPSEAARGRG